MASLRELLRTICLAKQWCYAAFWKMDLHNPKLLVWEECYSEYAADVTFYSTGCNSNAMDKFSFLIAKMMTKHQVVVVGQGMLGDAMYTGKYKWILLNSYFEGAQLSEVMEDLQLQVSVGMQTIVVIPAYPFGLVQLGSSFSIAENTGYVNAVKSLILQMGCSHGRLLPSATFLQSEPTKTCVADINAMRSSPMVVPSQRSEHNRDHLSSEVEIGFQKTSSSSNAEDQSCATVCNTRSGNDLYDLVGVGLGGSLADVGGTDSPSGGLEDAWADTSTVVDTQNSSSDYYSDHLLDAVVSKASSSLCKTSGDHSSVRMPKAGNGGPVSIGFAANAKPDVGSFSRSASFFTPPPKHSSWPGFNMMMGEGSISTAFSKRSDDFPRPNRKRVRPGEVSRPRPKDRQLIQDRVKELRDIVPNGAKCSIDALLERTIKHMLFLQNVAKHADKLKLIGESKIVTKEGELRLRDGFDGGATWAYEVGSKQLACPLIVEDLDAPRHLIIEMVCEDCGLFLEIADIVRGMGLTILKGVVEAFDDKIWARFAVEANRDVTRIEVFMSLVGLLEHTLKASGPLRNSFPVRSDSDQTVVCRPSSL